MMRILLVALISSLLLEAAHSGTLDFQVGSEIPTEIMVCSQRADQCIEPDGILSHKFPEGSISLSSEFEAGETYYLISHGEVISKPKQFPPQPKPYFWDSLQSVVLLLTGAFLSTVLPLIISFFAKRFHASTIRKRAFKVLDSWENENLDDTIVKLRSAGLSEFDLSLLRAPLRSSLSKRSAGDLTAKATIQEMKSHIKRNAG